MRSFGLIGYPLHHSFSQKYFTEKFFREGIRDAVYSLFPLLHIEALPQLLADHPHLEGLNITIPHKEKLLPYLHRINEVVRQTGACNCIRIRNGLLEGFNTDTIGFEQSLLRLLGPRHRKALILGTGGGSKAVAYVLSKLGIAYRWVSRTPSAEFLTYDDLDENIMKEFTLVVNTTPLGTFPRVEEFPPLPYDKVGPGHYFFDLVYNPEKTVFLQRAEEKGALIQNGYAMLTIQAEESWKIWNQRD